MSVLHRIRAEGVIVGFLGADRDRSFRLPFLGFAFPSELFSTVVDELLMPFANEHNTFACVSPQSDGVCVLVSSIFPVARCPRSGVLKEVECTRDFFGTYDDVYAVEQMSVVSYDEYGRFLDARVESGKLRIGAAPREDPRDLAAWGVDLDDVCGVSEVCERQVTLLGASRIIPPCPECLSYSTALFART